MRALRVAVPAAAVVVAISLAAAAQEKQYGATYVMAHCKTELQVQVVGDGVEERCVVIKALSTKARYGYKTDSMSKKAFVNLDQGAAEKRACVVTTGSVTITITNHEYNESKGCNDKKNDPKDSDIRVCVPNGSNIVKAPTVPTGESCQQCGANFAPAQRDGTAADPAGDDCD